MPNHAHQTLDTIAQKAAQLNAMLTMMTSEDSNPLSRFDLLKPEFRASYVELMAALAEEICNSAEGAV